MKRVARYLSKDTFVRIIALVLCAMFVTTVIGQPVTAMSEKQRSLFQRQIYYFDHDRSALCTMAEPNAPANEAAGGGSGGTNIDYAGNEILTRAQLQTIAENSTVYRAAAEQVGIPWQMLAVIHLRESGLFVRNPGNGQGIYQFFDLRGGPYPTGPVSESEFLRQTILAAQFLKNVSAPRNYAPNRQLEVNSPPEVIKDTFFSYNGRAGVYEEQARRHGFTMEFQGYEGSPYVMNKADAKRDPSVNRSTWGQIKRDRGPIEYPANNDYGAFVTYGALAGISSGGSCNVLLDGSVREKVAALARQELELWQSGELVPGTGYRKYSQGRAENWCADFVSWIFNQAGYPLIDGNEGNVPAVATIKTIGERGGNFTYHPIGTYQPQVGDIVIQQNGVSHTNIVVAVEGSTGNTRITVIGGNQGGTSGFNTSRVTQYTMTVAPGGPTTGFVTYNSN